MAGTKTYSLGDFKIGENVIPKGSKGQIHIVVSIDKQRNVIICRLPSERTVNAYFPYELEKGQ